MAKVNGGKLIEGKSNGIYFFDPFPDEENPAAGWGMMVGRGVARVNGDFAIPAADESRIHFIGSNGKLYERIDEGNQVDKKP